MTISDIAEQAGVSAATVSRLLSGQGYVATNTAERIRQCMQAMGYEPRRRTRTRTVSGTILLLSLLPYPPAEMYRMSAFPALLGGVQEAADEQELDLLLAHCPNGVLVPPALATGKVDGVLLVGQATELAPSLMQHLEEAPVVWLHSAPSDRQRRFDRVVCNNVEVGRLAAEYLRDRGHRQVDVVNLDPTDAVYCERSEVFAQVASSFGVAVRRLQPSRSIRRQERPAFLEAALHDAARESGVPTGLFCCADDFLPAVHWALGWLGPRQAAAIDLIGCDNDSQFLDQIHPRPATIDLKLELVGRQAVELLRRRLSGEAPVHSSVDITIRPALVPGMRRRPTT